MGYERFFLQHLKSNIPNKSFYEERKIFFEIINNEKILNEIKKNIIIDNNILKDLYYANKIPKHSKEFKILRDKIINVDEFENLN